MVMDSPASGSSFRRKGLDPLGGSVPTVLLTLTANCQC
jgi:hypothetical protein